MIVSCLREEEVTRKKHKVLTFNDVSRAYVHAQPAWRCVRRTRPSGRR